MGRASTGSCPFSGSSSSSSSASSYPFLPPSLLLYAVLALGVYVLGYLHGKAAAGKYIDEEGGGGGREGGRGGSVVVSKGVGGKS